jgi:hypothetical protein
MTAPTAQEDLVQLAYVSAATVAFDGTRLKTLLSKARANNAGLGITGMLLFHQGWFLQVLEGPTAAVTAVISRIEKDSRHNRLMVLTRRPLSGRSFGDWSMGLMKTDSNALKGAAGLNDLLADGVATFATDPERLHRFLQGFRDGLWRQTLS